MRAQHERTNGNEAAPRAQEGPSVQRMPEPGQPQGEPQNFHPGYAGENMPLPEERPQNGADNSQEPMAIAKCVHCETVLTYPRKSLYIQCPKCSHTMNPQAPNTNYINCVGCETLLSHPPSSLTIQCPKCLVIMELPVKGGNMNPDNGIGDKDSRKRRKDPNAPRRASNAYMIFCKERRAQLKEDRPDLAFGKLGAKLGEMWREMSTEERKPYEAKAALDRERFKREMETYNADLAERKKRIKVDNQDQQQASQSLPPQGPPPSNGSLPQPYMQMRPGMGGMQDVYPPQMHQMQMSSMPHMTHHMTMPHMQHQMHPGGMDRKNDQYAHHADMKREYAGQMHMRPGMMQMRRMNNAAMGGRMMPQGASSSHDGRMQYNMQPQTMPMPRDPSVYDNNPIYQNMPMGQRGYGPPHQQPRQASRPMVYGSSIPSRAPGASAQPQAAPQPPKPTENPPSVEAPTSAKTEGDGKAKPTAQSANTGKSNGNDDRNLKALLSEEDNKVSGGPSATQAPSGTAGSGAPKAETAGAQESKR